MKINVNNTKFLNTAEDIKHKDIVSLVDGGMWEESTRFKKKDGTPSNSFKIKIKLPNGEVRSATLNWTNVKLLVSAFGDESDNWVSKEVRAWKTKSEKAKSGFVFVFVPMDWVRNDIGEWENAEGVKIDTETEIKPAEYPDVEVDEIPEGDIPFD
jgi:hypothetical protein